jgi:multiple sugar transport system substrate-binding protein
MLKVLRVITLDFIAFRKALAKQVELFNRHFRDFKVEMEFVASYQELYDLMIEKGGVFSGKYDIFLCLTDWLPELVKMEGLMPLDPYIRQNPPEDWPNAWSESLLRLQRDKKGRIYGFPYHDGPTILMYRKDLFENEGEKRKYWKLYGRPLEIPETWSDFLKLAKFFTRPDENLYGTVLGAFPDGHMNVYDFLLHLYSRGGRLLDQNLNPAFNTPEGIDALQFYVDLIWKHKVAPKESLRFNCHKAGQYYLDGNAAIVWQWSGFACMAEIPEYSKIVGKSGYALLPRGEGSKAQRKTLNVYWVFTIPAGSEQNEVAYEFLRILASRQSDKITTISGAIGCRLSTWSDEDVQKKWPFYTIMEKLHENIETPPQIPEYAKINEILNKMMSDAVNLRKPVEVALNEAALEIKNLN